MSLLKLVDGQIKEQEKRNAADSKHDAQAGRLRSLPGMGPILSAGAEIDYIGRFATAEKLCAYAGLAPSTPFQRRQNLARKGADSLQ
jgi:transposase